MRPIIIIDVCIVCNIGALVLKIKHKIYQRYFFFFDKSNTNTLLYLIGMIFR